MKELKLIIFLLLFPMYLISQPKSTVFFMGGEGNDHIAEIAQDASNNVYIFGNFEKELKHPSSTIKSNGQADIFLAKMNPAGKIVWMKSFGGKLHEEAAGMAVRGDDIYIMGSFMGEMVIGNKTLKSEAARDIFIAKVSSSGDVHWSKAIGGKGNFTGVDMKIDRNNNIYGVLSFRNKITIAGKELDAIDGRDVLIFKMNPDGNILWTDQQKGLHQDKAAQLAIDAEGNVYLAGTYQGTVNIGGNKYTVDGNSDAFLTKYAPEGEILYVQRSRGESQDIVNDLVVDPAGNVYLTGSFARFIEFGAEKASSASDKDLYLVKYNNEGNVEWLRYASGGIAHDRSNSIALDHNGNVYLTGLYTNNITFIDKNLQGSPSTELFIATYSPGGELISVRSAGGLSSDEGLEVIATSENEIIAAGEFLKRATIGDKDLISAGGKDIYIWKIAK